MTLTLNQILHVLAPVWLAGFAPIAMIVSAPGQMPLRRRLLLVSGCVVAGMIILVSFMSKRLLLRNSVRVEEQVVRGHVEWALGVLSAERASLGMVATGYVAREDVARFMEDEDAAPARLGFPDDESLRALRLNLMVLTRSDGRPVFGRMLDLTLPPDALLRHFPPGSGLTNSVDGFLSLPEGPMLVVSRPIRAGGGDRAVRGVLIVGRLLGKGDLRCLSGKAPVALDLVALSSGNAAGAFAGLPRVPGSIVVRPRDARMITGYTCLADIHGEPALVLKVTIARSVYEQGLLTVRYEVSLGFLLIGFALAAVAVWLVERHRFNAPLDSVSRLSKGIRTVAARGSLSGRVELQEADQLAALVGAINEMLQTLEAAQKRTEQRQQELNQAHKLTALGTLVSGVAHEVNNPNNVVMLNATVLRQFWELIRPMLEEAYRRDPGFMIGARSYAEVRDEIPHLLSGILSASSRISALVGELKTFARREPGGLSECVDINAVVRSALLLLRHSIEKSSAHVSVECGEGLPAVRGNFQRLEQVVVNLVQNACQALTARDQAIRVATASTADGKSVTVTIEDRGRGIPSDIVDHITDPFFTTRREEGGTGLGLSVSLDIVNEHGGTMRFDSQEGRGTTVTVTLPVRIQT